MLAAVALLMRAELAAPDAVPVARAVQPAFTMPGTIMLLFFATTDVFRLRELRGPDPARRARRGVPTAQLVRVPGCTCSAASSPWPASLTPGGAPTSAGSPTPRSATPCTPRASAATCGGRPGDLGSRHHPRERQHDHHDPDAPGPRHDDVPDADHYVEHPGHHLLVVMVFLRSWPRALFALAADRSILGVPGLQREPAARCCGSTSSCSSATPRSTSWRCRSSASSPEVIPVFSRKPVFATRAWCRPRC